MVHHSGSARNRWRRMFGWSRYLLADPAGLARASRLCGALVTGEYLLIGGAGSLVNNVGITEYCSFCPGLALITLFITTFFLSCSAVALGVLALARLRRENEICDPESIRRIRRMARLGLLVGTAPIFGLLFWLTGSVYPVVIFGVVLMLAAR
jgi:hypothetical protein